MALLDKFKKQPDEIKKYQINYSEWLGESETVTSVATAVELLNPEPSDVGEPTLLVGATAVIAGTMFEYYLSLGTDKKRYKITFLADTTESQRVESEIEFKVDDL